MAKDTITLDGTFQQIANGVVTVTVLEIGDGSIELSDNVSGDNSYIRSRNQIKTGDQFLQNEAVPTYAKGDGWVVVVDGDI